MEAVAGGNVKLAFNLFTHAAFLYYSHQAQEQRYKKDEEGEGSVQKEDNNSPGWPLGKNLKPERVSTGAIQRVLLVLTFPIRVVAKALGLCIKKLISPLRSFGKHLRRDSTAAFRFAAYVDNVCGIALFVCYGVAVTLTFTLYN